MPKSETKLSILGNLSCLGIFIAAAPTTTGPAKDPRPTSSTPITIL